MKMQVAMSVRFYFQIVMIFEERITLNLLLQIFLIILLPALLFLLFARHSFSAHLLQPPHYSDSVPFRGQIEGK